MLDWQLLHLAVTRRLRPRPVSTIVSCVYCTGRIIMAKSLDPLVKTADGLLRGRIQKTASGSTFFSFQGIPYAQPPVGPQRFLPPKQVMPWTGEREALKEGPICPSFMLGTKGFVEDSDEDCLFLNVYTNELPEETATSKKPVMVWIHGGGFYGGSGNSDFYGADHLTKKDVVLITINYRLGALGFLSLQNKEVPGNNGLRDQVEALRWVQRNVAAFAGDKNNVTIFGESAGSASVQFLMLSPLAKGLFHRAVSQSGSVLNPWALNQAPVETAFALGQVLGRETASKEELLEFLRTASARDIVEKSDKIMRLVEPDTYYLSTPFRPVVEPASADAFLSEDPEKLIRQGRLHDVPYLLGVNTLEGLVITARGLPPLNTKEELERLLPIHPNLKRGTPLADSILEKIKSYYFPNGYDEKRCVDVLSALYFLVGNNEVLNGLRNATGRKSKTFVYNFTYDGGLSLFKGILGLGKWKGTLHADELSYLFYSNMMGKEAVKGSADERMISTMCQMWTEFARSGDPTPDTKLWPVHASKDQLYLEIGDELKAKSQLYKEDMSFWSPIFAQFNGPHAPKL